MDEPIAPPSPLTRRQAVALFESAIQSRLQDLLSRELKDKGLSSDPRALLRYTTTEQVLETYDFTAAVRTAMREFQPDVLLCAGPGTSLRAPVGHVVLREGWRGLRDKEALFRSGVVAVDR